MEYSRLFPVSHQTLFQEEENRDATQYAFTKNTLITLKQTLKHEYEKATDISPVDHTPWNSGQVLQIWGNTFVGYQEQVHGLVFCFGYSQLEEVHNMLALYTSSN